MGGRSARRERKKKQPAGIDVDIGEDAIGIGGPSWSKLKRILT